VSKSSNGKTEKVIRVQARDKKNEWIVIATIRISNTKRTQKNDGIGRRSQHKSKARKREEFEANMKANRNKKAKWESEGRSESLRNKSQREQACSRGNS